MPEGGQPRSCGGCTACCKTHAVLAIEKPPNVWCRDCTIGKGCAVYQSRPLECREFACAWLRGSGGEAERPDKVRFVCTTEIVILRGQTINWCTMVEVSVGAFERAPAQRRMHALHQDGWIVECFRIGIERPFLILPRGVSSTDIPALEAQLKKAVPSPQATS